MKKILQLFCILSIFACCNNDTILAQTYPKACITKSSIAIAVEKPVLGNKKLSPFTSVSPIVGKIEKATYSSLIVPVSFTRLSNVNGSWQLGPSVSVGLSYVLGEANASLHLDSSVTISENLYYGLFTTYGITQTDKGSASSYTIGAMGGFNEFGLFVGYDIQLKQSVIGIAYNLKGLPFLNGATKISLPVQN